MRQKKAHSAVFCFVAIINGTKHELTQKMYGCITRQLFVLLAGAPSLYGAKNIFLNTFWKSHHESNLPKNKTPEIFPPSPSWTWPPCLGKSAAASSRDLLSFSTADNQKNASCCWFFCETKEEREIRAGNNIPPPPLQSPNFQACPPLRQRKEGGKKGTFWVGGMRGDGC